MPLVLLDPALPDGIIDELLGQTGASIVVGEREYAGRRVLSSSEILAVNASGAIPPSCYAPESIAIMVATSGSLGQPKAVMLSARNLHAAATASAACTPLGVGDRWLACLPLFHIGGDSILFRCALAGAEAVLHQGFDADRVRHALAVGSITHLSLTPSMLAQLLEISAAAPPGLRHLLVGGAPLSGELAARAVRRGWPIQPTYGMSETASQVATLSKLALPWRPGRMGEPLPGVELALNPDGRLKIRGPMVMAGYANPALTPGDGLEDGWFVSGDLAEITAEGELVVLGRADEIIVSGGKKIHPLLVENELARCPGVNAVAVAGRPDAVWGEVVTAIFSGDRTAESLLAWCYAHVAGALRPRLAVRVAALPSLANGKADRLALRKLAMQGQAETGRIA